MIENKLRVGGGGVEVKTEAKSFALQSACGVDAASIVSNLNAINLRIGGHPDTTFVAGNALNGTYDAMYYGSGCGGAVEGSGWANTYNSGGGLIVGTFQVGGYDRADTTIGDIYDFFTSSDYGDIAGGSFSVPSGNPISDLADVTGGIHSYYGARSLAATGGGTAFGYVPEMNGAEWVQYDSGSNRYIANQISVVEGPAALNDSSYVTDLNAYKLLVAQLYWAARAI